MALFRGSYPFTTFTELLATESGRKQEDVAVIVAEAIAEKKLRFEFLDPRYPGINHYGDPSFDDGDQLVEDLAIDVSDHVARVGKGTEAPDFEERLRFVSLNRPDVEAWLSECGEAMPEFWRGLEIDDQDTAQTSPAAPKEPGETDYGNLLKITAVLAHLLAKTEDRFRKEGDAVKVSELVAEIRDFIDNDKGEPPIGDYGLQPSTLSKKISAALTALRPERKR
jgi:hypothetical protein